MGGWQEQRCLEENFKGGVDTTWGFQPGMMIFEINIDPKYLKF